MGRQVLQFSEDDFNYMKFESKKIPSIKRLCNYKTMREELVVDEHGNILNPFTSKRNMSTRFHCFEALRRDVSLEQLSEKLGLTSEREIHLLKRTYLQVKKCYFS